MKEPEDGFSDEQQESSDEDMEWSGNNSLFANLSIPQLDGAADESSGESSRAETTLECQFALTLILNPLLIHVPSRISEYRSDSSCTVIIWVDSRFWLYDLISLCGNCDLI